MKKIIIFIIVILILIGGGFFWWWNQKDVRELNKNLPEGVKVVKSLFGKEYKVVNKIDGYEVKVPKKWGGLREVDYTPERIVEEMRVASINLTESEGEFIAIDVYKLEKLVNLESWVNELMEKFELVGLLEKKTIKNFEVIKTKEEEHLAGLFIYFLNKNLKIYVISGFSEGTIQDIILNSNW